MKFLMKFFWGCEWAPNECPCPGHRKPKTLIMPLRNPCRSNCWVYWSVQPVWSIGRSNLLGRPPVQRVQVTSSPRIRSRYLADNYNIIFEILWSQDFSPVSEFFDFTNSCRQMAYWSMNFLTHARSFTRIYRIDNMQITHVFNSGVGYIGDRSWRLQPGWRLQQILEQKGWFNLHVQIFVFGTPSRTDPWCVSRPTHMVVYLSILRIRFSNYKKYKYLIPRKCQLF